MSFQVKTVKEYFERLGERFDAKGSAGVDAIYQFELSDPDGATYHVHVKDGTMELKEGAHEKPTTTIKMSGENFVKMSNGSLNGQMAFMSGKMKIAGSIPMAMKMKNIFPPA
jgi:putative sterol carrier protein